MSELETFRPNGEGSAPSSAAVTKEGDDGRHAHDAERRAQRLAALLRLLEDNAPDVDFYVALRHLDAFLPSSAPLGRAARPRDEPVKLSQYPSLIFAPSTLHSFVRDDRREGVEGRLSVYHFGLFGPHGPLPGHLTEYVQERLIHHRDETMLRFLDMFQHRMLLLFYRAWADCQSTLSLDRPAEDHFTRYVASLTGYGQPGMRNRDHVPDHWKFGLSGHLVRTTRNAEGLGVALRALLRVPVDVECFVRQWLRLDRSELTALAAVDIAGGTRGVRVETGNHSSRLGMGAVAGEKVLDVQHRFRLRLGPLRLVEFERFLPGSSGSLLLRDFVRDYLGIELTWDVRLVLRRDEVPSARLGTAARLGWNSWLDMPVGRRSQHAEDVLLQYERSDPAVAA